MHTGFVPFSVSPTPKIIEIGTPQTGVIRLLKKGSLTVAEHKAFDDFAAGQPDGFAIIASTANKIAANEGISSTSAYKALVGDSEEAGGQDALDIRLKYASELMGMNRDLERSAWQRKVYGATLMLRRTHELVTPGAQYPGMLPLAQEQAAEMRQFLASWSEEQTLQLPHALIDLFWNFFESERAGASPSADSEPPSLKKADADLERELGKPASSGESPAPTGQKFTGGSPATGQETTASTTTDSAPAPSL